MILFLEKYKNALCHIIYKYSNIALWEKNHCTLCK